MHKIAMEMGKWAMEQAKAHGFDNLSAQDWDDLKDCMEIVKSAICADKDYREVEAMDDFEKEYGRMGYRGRAANGRFVHRPGRGRSAGYTPYLHMMDDGMDDYDMYDDIPYPMTGYRMGYTGGRGRNSGSYSGNNGNRGGNSNDGNSGNSNSYGYDGGNNGNSGGGYGYDRMNMRQPSRYGESYDRYDQNRRHYTETKNPEDKKAMKQSVNDIYSDMENMIDNIMEYADAADKPELKQKFVQMAQKVQNMK